MGFGLMNRLIDRLKAVTTNNCNIFPDFHITDHPTLSLLGLLSLVFTWQQLSTMATLLQCLSNGDSSSSIARWLTFHS
jgi:hypothetical protein